MFTLRQYLFALEDPEKLLRTLGDAVPCRRPDGRLQYSVGNSAAVFRIVHRGRIRALRCYFRPMRRLSEIYGAGYLPREIYLHTSPGEGTWADAVVSDWVEGVTLHEAVAAAAGCGDTQRLGRLSEAFDRLAAALVADDRAHGDLKPENIIVTADGSLQPIDFDAAFLPAFAHETSSEMGTAAYQHPARTAADFDASLDDYPAALIATALHALRRDPALFGRYAHRDGLLYTPAGIRRDEALRETLDLFEREGAAAEYRIARLLLAPTLRLPGLGSLLLHAAGPGPAPQTLPELYAEEGLWGFRTTDRRVTPPLWECGFDFSEGLAAVRLGRTWHYIDPAGRTLLRCPQYEAVKPFRNGRAQVFRDGRRLTIDHEGNEFDF